MQKVTSHLVKLCAFLVTLFAFQQAGAQCNADFSFAVNDSTRIVQFTNLSTPTGDSVYQWYFGAGGYSDLKNPSYQFSSAGTYMVCLYYFAPGCWDSTCKLVTIDSITNNCQANFGYSVNHTTKTVTFSNLSGGTDSSYLWRFGDNTSSGVKKPVHTYATPGTYTVCLKRLGPICFDSICRTVTINNVCNINFNYTINHVTKKVTFTNTSTGDTSFTWKFGNGDSSFLRNPVYTYNSAGTYTVCLKRRGPVCFDSICKTIIINNICSTGFTYSTNGKTVTFNNTSTGDTSYTWRFGDANSSGLKNPSHTYANNGVYTVCLKRNGPICFDSICKTVQVFDSCNANFTYTIIPGTRTVKFTNLSTGSPDTAYNWSFVGSGSSDQINPVHTFPMSKTYRVCLMQMGACRDSVCKLINIISTDTCIADFSYAVDSINNTVYFYNGSTAPDSSYHWTFGDNTSSWADNPVHVYPGQGNYLVCLTIMSPCFDSICKLVKISATSCNADFYYWTDSLTNELHFVNTSTGPDSAYYWTFGDNTGSNLKNPVHAYAAPGNYLVCLIKTSPCFDSICKMVMVPGFPCTADFAYWVDTVTNKVTFINTSTGPDSSYYWTFGDNTGSGIENPTHTYAGSGIYLVCLFKMSPCFDSICKLVVIPGSPCNADFSYGVDTFTNTVYFYNTSTGPDSSYYWSFGDNTGSGLKNPSHVYPGPGSYLVCLTKLSPCFDSICKLVVIHGSPCNADFSYGVDTLTNTVYFYNTSTGPDSSYYWSFGDNTTSGIENPVHTYPGPGTYTVCLIKLSPCFDSICKLVVIQGSSPCNAEFSYSVDPVTRTVTFNNLSTGDNDSSYFWYFGGTRISGQKNPTHTFPSAGTYLVCLTIFGNCEDSVCKLIVIGNDTTAGCHADFDFALYPDSVDGVKRIAVFSNLSSGSLLQNLWSFGDGDFGSQVSPMHYYSVNGTYTVCLVITDTIGMCFDSVCKTIYIGPDSVPTGLTERSAGIANLNIYPVPFNESMKIQFESISDKPVSIRIYNALGMLQVSETRPAIVGANIYEVNTERLARGVYFIELSTERGTITRRTVK